MVSHQGSIALRRHSRSHRELDVLLPDIDYVEIPVDWWDAEADKSLLIGVFKHGMFLRN